MRASTNIFSKYEYLTSEEVLPSDRNRMIEQATFTYSTLVKALKKITKKKNRSLRKKTK